MKENLRDSLIKLIDIKPAYSIVGYVREIDEAAKTCTVEDTRHTGFDIAVPNPKHYFYDVLYSPLATPSEKVFLLPLDERTYYVNYTSKVVKSETEDSKGSKSSTTGGSIKNTGRDAEGNESVSVLTSDKLEIDPAGNSSLYYNASGFRLYNSEYVGINGVNGNTIEIDNPAGIRMYLGTGQFYVGKNKKASTSKFSPSVSNPMLIYNKRKDFTTAVSAMLLSFFDKTKLFTDSGREKYYNLVKNSLLEISNCLTPESGTENSIYHSQFKEFYEAVYNIMVNFGKSSAVDATPQINFVIYYTETVFDTLKGYLYPGFYNVFDTTLINTVINTPGLSYDKYVEIFRKQIDAYYNGLDYETAISDDNVKGSASAVKADSVSDTVTLRSICIDMTNAMDELKNIVAGLKNAFKAATCAAPGSPLVTDAVIINTKTFDDALDNLTDDIKLLLAQTAKNDDK